MLLMLLKIFENDEFYEIARHIYLNVEIYELNNPRDIEPSLFDELYEQVKVYFQEDYNIKANDLQW